jgi:uncharacterized protein DUF4347
LTRNLGLEQLEARILFSTAAAASPPPVPNARELPVLALIDSSLPDQQLLIQSLPNVQKIFFNPDTESAASVLQRTIDVAKELGGNIQAIIILSHGASGEFELGDNIVSNQTLNATSAQWKTLGGEIAPGGSIDLFTCDTGYGPLGQNLLDQLNTLTHAGVFGSGSDIHLRTALIICAGVIPSICPCSCSLDRPLCADISMTC